MTTPFEPLWPVGENDRHSAVHFFNANRLILAREFRGCQQKDLAEAIHKTSGAISQFESGKATPDVATLSKISLALGFPIGFFGQKDRVSLIESDQCHFRSQRSVREVEKRKVLATGTLLCELFSVIEEWVELPEEKVSSIRHDEPNSLSDIEHIAEEVRSYWGLGMGPIPNMIRLLETKGVVISFVGRSSKKLDAFSTWHAGRPFVFLSSENGSSSRSRFNAAHELGHLVMHREAIAGNRERENEANRFASAFLVPRKPFVSECPRWLNWEHFYEMKRRWKVSVAALVKRAYDLECLSQASYRRAFMQLSERGERLSEKYEPQEEEPSILEKSLDLLQDELPLQQLSSILCWGMQNLEQVRNSTRLDAEEVLEVSGAVNIDAKPSDTIFDGYRFRNRLEARWAVFLKALGIKFQYEREQFSLACGSFLPDFYLPNERCWIEVGWTESEEICEMCFWLSEQTGQKVLYIVGEPWPEEYKISLFDHYLLPDEDPRGPGEAAMYNLQFAEDRKVSFCLWVSGDEGATSLTPSNDPKHGDKYPVDNTEWLRQAYEAARQARFDYSQPF